MRLRAWLYYRLSRDEDTEMESLNNQRGILVDYCKDNDYEIVGESFDDNVSGMTIERDGIEKITEQVLAGNIDAVIVKDMSRLGRHRAKTELYMDFLRVHDVRVLSVVEGLDSMNENDDIVIGVKGVVNDYYAKDISKKVRAGIRQKQKAVGLVTKPPFGYWKDKNTGEIKIDEDKAEVVRFIFDRYLEGYGIRNIARTLEERDIKPPHYYTSKDKEKNFYWQASSVKKILMNVSYTGLLINNKVNVNKILHISKNVPESDWILHEDFYPVIIPKSTFDSVQLLMEMKANSNIRVRGNTPYHRYAGLLTCADCGSTFFSKPRVYKENTYVDYVCNGYQHFGKKYCTPHTIREDAIDNALYDQLGAMREELLKSISALDIKKKDIVNLKGKNKKEIEETEALLLEKVEDQKKILLARARDLEHADAYEEMLSDCDKEIAKMKDHLLELKDASAAIEKRRKQCQASLTMIDTLLEERVISNVNLRLLINKIYVKQVDKELVLEIDLNGKFGDNNIIYDFATIRRNEIVNLH